MTRRVILGLGLAGAIVASVHATGTRDATLEGRAEGGGAHVPAVEAAFELESYRPGTRGRLVIRDRARLVVVQIFQSGPERVPTKSDTEMNGVPVTPRKRLRREPGRQPLWVPIGRWQSGLYFARLEAPDGRVGFAPFVVAPRRLGVHRVAVVLPTLTWQAYNFRDDDGDGTADTWYAGKSNATRLGRAHLDRGVPYGFRFHLGFHNWLHWTAKPVDYLSQWDLEHVDGPQALARAYDLVVFAGHHEYVTQREYDLVEEYRNLGGNLMFLSANNFFWFVERRGDVLVRNGRARDVGRPEAALVGVQYVANRHAPRGTWVARFPARSWLFAGTGVRQGSGFGRGGVEIDQTTADSPAGIRVVAEIPNLFGPGKTAQMTYYEMESGARVFAAGAFHLTRTVTSDPVVWRLLENLWTRTTKR